MQTLHERLAAEKYKFANKALQYVDGMTRETRDALRAADRKPGEKTAAGKRYDLERARKYMENLFEGTVGKVIVDEASGRPCACRFDDGETVAIPHWDFGLEVQA